MFLPMHTFWALDDQQGSVWVVQATQMDSRLWGSFQLSLDQLPVAIHVATEFSPPRFEEERVPERPHAGSLRYHDEQESGPPREDDREECAPDRDR